MQRILLPAMRKVQANICKTIILFLLSRVIPERTFKKRITPDQYLENPTENFKTKQKEQIPFNIINSNRKRISTEALINELKTR